MLACKNDVHVLFSFQNISIREDLFFFFLLVSWNRVLAIKNSFVSSMPGTGLGALDTYSLIQAFQSHSAAFISPRGEGTEGFNNWLYSHSSVWLESKCWPVSFPLLLSFHLLGIFSHYYFECLMCVRVRIRTLLCLHMGTHAFGGLLPHFLGGGPQKLFILCFEIESLVETPVLMDRTRLAC